MTVLHLLSAQKSDVEPPSVSSRLVCVFWSSIRFSFGRMGVSEEMCVAVENCVSYRYFSAAAAAPAAGS